MSSPGELRGSRRAVARTLSDGERTASEIARALERPTGAVFGLLKRMTSEGLLATDTAAIARGTRYRLSQSARLALDEVDAEADRPGMLRQGHRLLLVEPRAGCFGEVQAILADPEFTATLAWAVETGAGWLLVTRAEAAHPFQRLRALLDRVARCEALVVDSVMSGGELSERAQWLLEDIAAHIQRRSSGDDG